MEKINPFLANISILYPLKILQTFYAFSAYKLGVLGGIVLIQKAICVVFYPLSESVHIFF